MKKFELGQLVVTRAVADRMQTDEKFTRFVQLSLGRYINCDWGSMADEDKAMNDAAVKSGEDRIHAAYVNKAGDKITANYLIIIIILNPGLIKIPRKGLEKIQFRFKLSMGDQR